MDNKDLVKRYCDAFKLTYIEAPEEPLDDEEEWPDVVAVGFFDNPMYCAPGIMLMVDDTIRVIWAHADGEQHWQDQWMTVDPPKVIAALLRGTELEASEGSKISDEDWAVKVNPQSGTIGTC